MSCAVWRSGVFVCVAIAMFFADGVLAAPATSFPTPEAAVQHFVKRLAADDLDDAMQAFSIDEVLARLDGNLDTRMNDQSTPSKYRTLARVARICVMAEIASATRRFVYGFLLDEMEDKLTVASDANIDRFIQMVDPARLKAVRIVRIDQPAPTVMNSAAAVNSAKAHAAKVGAEERTERIALFQLDGTYYQGGFTLFRYGNTWRIGQLESIYGGIGMHGHPVRKTTLLDYEELTK